MNSFLTIRHLACLLLALLVGSSTMQAQYTTWEECLSALVTLDGTPDNDTHMENLVEMFTELHEHPFDINSATRSDLERLPFLTPHQVEEILFYLDEYGPLHNAGELILIPALDIDARRLLPWFVQWGEGKSPPAPTLRELVERRRSELTFRTDIPLYRRAGYEPFTREQWERSPSLHYWGSPLYQSLRYASHSGNRLSWGLATERDAGEPFFVRGIDGEMLGKQGFDYYGGYVRLRDNGCLRDLIIGNYRLHFGMGLVMNSHFTLGKNTVSGNLERSVVGSLISSHGGTSESAYLCGGAATVALGKASDITAFFSYRRCDATLLGDSIATLLETGLHRTSIEIGKRGNTRTTLAGTHIRYHIGGFHLGATATWQTFNRPLATGSQEYRQHSPQGRTFVNLSADYTYCSRFFTLAGETAFSGNGALAILHTLRAEPFDRTFLTLLHRHYSVDYWGLQSNAFSEGSEVRNEDGVFISADIQAINNWRFIGSADLFRFPEQRYRVSEPSTGTDLQAMVQWMPTQQWAFSVRWRGKAKERNIAAAYRETVEGGLVRERTHRLRFSADGMLADVWTTHTTFDVSLVSAEEENRGLRIGQRLVWTQPTPTSVKAICKGLSISSECSWFHTTNYAARIYGYERGLLYAWNYRAFYGHGLRGMLMVKCTLFEALTCTAKIGGTHFFDRDTISSGAQLIPQNHAEDIALQLRWKF